MTDFWNQTHLFNVNPINQPLLIHVVSYQRPQALVCLLNSLTCQRSQNFDLCITHDEFHAETYHVVTQWAQTTNINTILKFTSKREGLWGHPMRAQVVQECDHDHILLTNDDNYYVPIFTETMIHAIQTHDAHLVMCDMIHSHNNPGDRVQPPYNLFQTAPKLMHCDVGCFITKTEMAKQVGFINWDVSWADGIFVDRIIQQPGIKWVKVPQVLFVHN
jgi:hypothetical protein